MPATKRYPYLLQVYLEKDTERELKSLANSRGLPIALIVRDMILRELSNEYANEGIDTVQTVVRDTMETVIKRTENRLAALIAKTCIASATAMYQTIKIIEDINVSDPEEIYEIARKKSASYLKNCD